LIGDPNGRHVGRVQFKLGEDLDRDIELRLPDLAGVVLDPAWLRVVLLELALSDADDRAGVVEDDRS
jgi:hypothetical protein